MHKKRIITALFCLLAAFSGPAHAESPFLQSPETGICLLDDFKNYTGAADISPGHPPALLEKLTYEEGALTVSPGQEWVTLTLPLRGAGKAPLESSPREEGDFSGAEGVAIRLENLLGGTASCNLGVQSGGTQYIIKPKGVYYLVIGQGAVYEGVATATDFGMGIIDSIGQDFNGYLVIPFSSLHVQTTGAPYCYQKADKIILTMYAGLGKGLRFKDLFLYGKNMESFRPESILSLFDNPPSLSGPALPTHTPVPLPAENSPPFPYAALFAVIGGAVAGAAYLLLWKKRKRKKAAA